MRIERFALPGVGTTVRFATAAGLWVGVLQRLDGQRELLVYAPNDPDTVQTSVHLTDQEAHELAEVLFSHHNADE